MVADGWRSTPPSALPLAINPETSHDLMLVPHPVASSRDPGIMAVTEEWGGQPSWKTAAGLGTFISIFLLHKHRTRCPLSITRV
jgi:hypothetical protein